jgi:hypothetical protein
VLWPQKDGFTNLSLLFLLVQIVVSFIDHFVLHREHQTSVTLIYGIKYLTSIVSLSSGVMMVAVNCSETSVTFYQTT